MWAFHYILDPQLEGAYGSDTRDGRDNALVRGERINYRKIKSCVLEPSSCADREMRRSTRLIDLQ